MKCSNTVELSFLGASSGIGLEVSKHLIDKCEEVITVSRRRPEVGKWIQTDVSDIHGIKKLSHELTDQVIDGLLYLGGTWEENAFTEDYSFEACSDHDIENVLNVNLLAPIRLIQKLLPNLKKSKKCEDHYHRSCYRWPQSVQRKRGGRILHPSLV